MFYTPTFIVDYIVARTVGRLLEGKTPKEVALLRFLDPACGSGSFLIAVFQFLQANGWGEGVLGAGPTRLVHDGIGFVVALISNYFLNVNYIWRRRPES